MLLSCCKIFDSFACLQNSIHQNIYGKSLAITTQAQLSSTIIENPEMLKYQQAKEAAEPHNAVGQEAQAPKLNSVVNGESLEDIRKVQPTVTVP